jgi:hypothetical protein
MNRERVRRKKDYEKNVQRVALTSFLDKANRKVLILKAHEACNFFYIYTAAGIKSKKRRREELVAQWPKRPR